MFHGIFVLHQECVLWLTTCDTFCSGYTPDWAFFIGGPNTPQADPFQDGASLAPLCDSHMVRDVLILLLAGRSAACSLCHLLILLFFGNSYHPGGQYRSSRKLFVAPFPKIIWSWTKMLISLYARGCVEAPFNCWVFCMAGQSTPISSWDRDWKIHSHEFL